MLVRIRNTQDFILKVNLAIVNLIARLDHFENQLAIDVHVQLSSQKKFFFWRKYSNLPSPAQSNLDDLLKIGNFKKPDELIELNQKAVILYRLLKIAMKSTKIPNYKFFIDKKEQELIDEWSQNKIP